MQRFPGSGNPSAPLGAPLVLVFERNDAVAMPLLAQLRMAGYDVRAARIPVEVFDLIQKEPIELVLIDLGNAAANRREFWVGLDSQRRNRAVHVITFRYMSTGETGELDGALRVARADVEIQSAQGFGALIEAVRARLPGATPVPQFGGPTPNLSTPLGSTPASPFNAPRSTPLPGALGAMPGKDDDSPFAQPYSSNPFKMAKRPAGPNVGTSGAPGDPFFGRQGPVAPPSRPFTPEWTPPTGGERGGATHSALAGAFAEAFGLPLTEHEAGNGSGSGAGANGNGRSNGNGNGRGPAKPAFDDAWTPPAATPPSRGIAYRGYDEEPLAPDDPRLEDATSEVPAIAYQGNGDHRNDRALGALLQEGAVVAPQRLDALRAIQQTLANVGMDFTLGDLAMLFKFLTQDQLLAALLVSRGIVDAEQIATLGRVRQEMQATGKDYSLEELLVMFNVLPADQIRALRAEIG